MSPNNVSNIALDFSCVQSRHCDLMEEILEQTSTNVFDVNELIPKESLFESFLRISLYACAAFQLVCLVYLVYFAPFDNDLAREADSSSELMKLHQKVIFQCFDLL